MAILQSNLDTSAKIVLVALSTYLSDDDNAWAWPSALTIARLTGLSERHVRRDLEQLQDAGILERQGQARRRIRWDAIRTPCPVSGTEDDSSKRTPCPESEEPKTDTMPATRTPCPDQNGHHVRRSDQDPTNDPTREEGAGAPSNPASSPLDESAVQVPLDVACRVVNGITGGSSDVKVVPKAVVAFFGVYGGESDIEGKILLVAAAAREAPGSPWADEIRAEGWGGRRNWSRRVATILDVDKWPERLALAQAWDRARKSRENGKIVALEEVRPGVLPRIELDDFEVRLNTLMDAGCDRMRALNLVSLNEDTRWLAERRASA